MKRALFLMLSMLVFGCGEDATQPAVKPSLYASPTAPESLIANLQTSYRNREIKEYAKLLAPEFKFVFQPIDANTIGTDSWNRDQDSTGTCALLATTQVSEIRIQLTHGARDATLDTSPPVDSVKVRIVTTDLQVDQTDGTTWVVSDQQDLFFRTGKAANGENPQHWFIYEWDDLPSLGSPVLAGGGSTWGSLKAMFGN
jgi:hypothetical protein